jgi:3-oxoacyl-[acyl-carrier-protein] synthase-1
MGTMADELPPSDAQYQDPSRLERMLLRAARKALEVAGERIRGRSALIFASTKGNIRHWPVANARRPFLQDVAEWLRDQTWPEAEVHTVSMACISGLAAVELAHQLIRCGHCDDVLVCAADEITDFVVSGFAAFKALAARPCRPYDRQREGLNLGEAAAALWLSVDAGGGRIRLGRPSITHDGVHISAPDRKGSGLARAVELALTHEDLSPSDVAFISAHGTATHYNDDMEATAFFHTHMSHTPLHSLKGYLGHSLGAAALVELILAIKALDLGCMPASAGFLEPGTEFPLFVVQEPYLLHQGPCAVLKTSSGFGGCNAAVTVIRET